MSVMILAAVAASSEELALPVAVGALAGDVLGCGIWDFSRQEILDDDAKTIVRVYGDSLMSETFGSRRFLYSTANDSIYFLGEEDLLTSIVLDNPAFIAESLLDCGSHNNCFSMLEI